ncbi:MAG: hypothetical protein PHC51_04400, partial [bacterium]|nr:hypothetical protein [bacterium]
VAAFTVFLLTTTGIDWIRYSSLARVDMVFALGVNITLLAILCLLHRWNNKREFSLSLATILAGGTALSVLAKGPAGLLLPGATLVFYLGHVWYHHAMHPTRAIPLIRTAVVFLSGLLIATLWYYLAYQHRGNDFLATQLFKENFARLTGEESVNVGHEHGFLYAVLMLLQDFAPWSLLFPLTGFYVLKILWSNQKSDLSTSMTGLFFTIWVGTLTAVLMVTASKRSVYFIPAYPAYVYLTVSAIYSFSNGQREKFFTRIIHWSEKTISLMSWSVLLVCTLLILFFIAQTTGLGMSIFEYFEHMRKNNFIKDAIYHIKPGILDILCLLIATISAFKARTPKRPQNGFASANLAIQKITFSSDDKNSQTGLQATPVILRQLILLSLSLMGLTTIGRLTFFAPLAELTTPKYFVASLAAKDMQDLEQFKSDFYPFIYYAGQNIPFASLDNPGSEKRGQKFLLWEKDLHLLGKSLATTPRVISRSADLSAKPGNALLIVTSE